MINRIILPMAVTILISCAPPPVELEGPTETVQASREVFYKGLRGGRTATPYAAVRTYNVTCTVAGGDIQGRANQSIARVEQQRGRIQSQAIGRGIQVNGERTQMNPILKQDFGCIIGGSRETKLTTTEREAIVYIAENNLFSELLSRR